MNNDSSDDNDRSRERTRRGDRERGGSNRNTDSSRDRSTDRGRDKGNKSSGHRVYVSNIPYEFRWQDLKDLFRVEVGEVQFVELFVDDKDKSKGCGIVEFADSKSVQKCLEVMQRFDVKGRKLVIKEDTGNVRDKHGSSVKRGSGGNRDEGRFHRQDRLDSHSSSFGGRSAPNDNTYGLSPSFLESLHIDLPLCCRVFVANLEYNVDKKKIKDIFRLAGRIQKIDLHTDKDGRSRGFAVIEYDHPVEAVQAISMFHNQFLYERQMTVRLDRVNDGTKLPEGLKGIGMGLGSNGEPLKDVARNLPSANSQQSNSLGVGILGAVPNSALQVANALSGLNNINPAALSSLAGNPSVFHAAQAANLGSLTGNLLGAGLGGGDLSLANSLVSNPLVQAPNQLAALSSINSSSNSSMAPFGRSDSGFGAGGGNSRFSSQYDSGNKNTNFGGYGNDSTTYNKLSDNANARGAVNVPKTTSGFSRKIVVSNLPTTASYKMLHDKFSEFGEVQHFEEKSAGTMLVMYASEWQAERAIKNLDRARIDGRTIDASFFI